MHAKLHRFDYLLYKGSPTPSMPQVQKRYSGVSLFWLESAVVEEKTEFPAATNAGTQQINRAPFISPTGAETFFKTRFFIG